MALFIFDFDHTIANGHTHNIIIETIKAEKTISGGKSKTAKDLDAQWDAIKHILPIGGADQLTDTIKKMLAHGHKVAIASFSAYGKNMIPRYLREVVKLPEELLDQIFITSWLPADPKTADKNEHIKEVIEHYHYDTTYKANIALIDDSPTNLLAAYQAGYTIFEGTPNGSHFADIDCFLEAISPENYDFFCEQQDFNPHGYNYTNAVKTTIGMNLDSSSEEEKPTFRF